MVSGEYFRRTNFQEANPLVGIGKVTREARRKSWMNTAHGLIDTLRMFESGAQPAQRNRLSAIDPRWQTRFACQTYEYLKTEGYERVVLGIVYQSVDHRNLAHAFRSCKPLKPRESAKHLKKILALTNSLKETGDPRFVDFLKNVGFSLWDDLVKTGHKEQADKILQCKDQVMKRNNS